jgi:hypothetical protein
LNWYSKYVLKKPVPAASGATSAER